MLKIGIFLKGFVMAGELNGQLQALLLPVHQTKPYKIISSFPYHKLLYWHKGFIKAHSQGGRRAEEGWGECVCVWGGELQGALISDLRDLYENKIQGLTRLASILISVICVIDS